MLEMQNIVIDDRGVCPSVCPLVGLSRGLSRFHCTKTAQRIQIQFGINSLGGQSLGGDPNPETAREREVGENLTHSGHHRPTYVSNG